MLLAPIYPMRTPQEKRDGYVARYNQMKAERSPWDTYWFELERNLFPHAAQFSLSQRTQIDPTLFGRILDNTAFRSRRVLSAGMMSGMTSPARPWFVMIPRDVDLRDSIAVRRWLDIAAATMQTVFARSNVYRALHAGYDDLGTFGTHAVLVLSDYETLIRCYPCAIGQYCLQQDFQGRVTTFYREFQSTVVETVDEFGLENCSVSTQEAYKARNFEAPVTILHAVEPRKHKERVYGSPLSKDMPWISCYLELSGDDSHILRESGFKRMRVLAPRWTVHKQAVYGISPGMEALGDVMQLQHEQLRKGTAIDYQTLPPLQMPQSLKDRERDGQPGGISYYPEPGTTLPYDQTTAGGGIRPAYEVRLDLNALLLDIQDVRTRIKQAYFEDLFLMLAVRDTASRMTATEVLERQEEKLLMIGPVIERLTNEYLEPLIDITFQEMLEVGALPPPPAELIGREIEVEFVSILAQAQRAVGITSTQQWVNDVLTVGATVPSVLDIPNFDEWTRDTAYMRGVPAKMVVDEESVDRLRKARADAQAAEEQVALAQGSARAAKDLSTVPVDPNGVLRDVFQLGA